MKKVLGNVGVGFAVLLIVAFVFFGIRGIMDPTAASMRFGLPADDPAEMFYYRVYLARNLVIVSREIASFVQNSGSLVEIISLQIELPKVDECRNQDDCVVNLAR